MSLISATAFFLIACHWAQEEWARRKLQEVPTLLSVTGTPLKPQGAYLLDIIVGTTTFYHRFLVVDDTLSHTPLGRSFDAILGIDFMANHDAILDFPARKFHLKEASANIIIARDPNVYVSPSHSLNFDSLPLSIQSDDPLSNQLQQLGHRPEYPTPKPYDDNPLAHLSDLIVDYQPVWLPTNSHATAAILGPTQPQLAPIKIEPPKPPPAEHTSSPHAPKFSAEDQKILDEIRAHREKLPTQKKQTFTPKELISFEVLPDLPEGKSILFPKGHVQTISLLPCNDLQTHGLTTIYNILPQYIFNTTLFIFPIQWNRQQSPELLLQIANHGTTPYRFTNKAVLPIVTTLTAIGGLDPTQVDCIDVVDVADLLESCNISDDTTEEEWKEILTTLIANVVVDEGKLVDE